VVWVVDEAMKKRTWVFGGVALAALAGAAFATKTFWSPDGAVAQAPRGQQGSPRAVPVELAQAVRKPVPVRLDALGTVTPIASVAIKPRIDTEIVGVHFSDGATVKQGDLLFTLDSRAIETEIKRVDAVLTGAKAQLEQNERDVQRYTELVARNATTLVTLQNAKTQVNIWRATAESSSAQIESLNVQLSYCTIRAPISGRVSSAAVKVGNIVRQADAAPLASINQIAPIYVSFGLPQRVLPEVRDAMAEGSASVEAVVPGESRRASGRLTMIENAVETATGMVTLRATMENTDEVLWPGTLVNAYLTLRVEKAVTVPSVAVQVGQTGNFVYVVKDGVASVRPVTASRAFEGETVIEKGLDDGEVVVVDGALLLTNGSRVAPREGKAGT
jgi:multidrug efflux system membrane fusion protein